MLGLLLLFAYIPALHCSVLRLLWGQRANLKPTAGRPVKLTRSEITIDILKRLTQNPTNSLPLKTKRFTFTTN
jgi:hypothetical protein